MKKKWVKMTALLLAASLAMTGCGKENAAAVTPTAEADGVAGDVNTDKEDSDPEGDVPAGEEGAGAENYTLAETAVHTAQEVVDVATDFTKRSNLSLGNTRRLQQALAKMNRGEEVKVAYLGGSITEGYLVNSRQNYAYKTTRWLQKTFQNENIRGVNAGLSGTSSTIGLLRVQQDVIEEQPDLVFVEFAVNDANDTTSKMMYESLVKRLLESESAPAVVLIFTVLESGYTCEEHMSAVGEAFRLPMISVNASLEPEFTSGSMVWADYSLDSSHPNNDGHTMIAEFIEYLIAQVIVKDTLDEEMNYSGCKALGAPYTEMNFYNTKNLYASDLGGFVEANSDISHFPNDWIWNKNGGGSLKFSMSGRNLIMLYKENSGTNMAKAEVYVDGKLKTTVDGYSEDGWNNPQTALIINDVNEGEHEIEIKITEDSAVKNFHILGFGSTGTLTGQERVAQEDMTYQERAVQNVGNTYRLQQLMARAEAGEELTIGFIGGSITMGSGASNANKCYAKLVYDWWCETYPQAKFNYVNAGIGATTSQFGVARAEEDLLRYEPDFVVVEFSVNDEGSSFYGETYESLVRKILTDKSEPAVMVLNMVQYDSGVNAQLIHNEVASLYELPAVSMQNSIYKEITLGNLTAEEVSADMLHPNDRGHAYGAEIVAYYLQKVKDGIYSSAADAELPQPLYSLRSMSSVRYDNRNIKPVLNGFTADTAVQNGITDVFKNGYTAKDEGASIVFENIYGSTICLQYCKTNTLGAPLAVAVIDGDEAKAVVLDGNYPNGWGNWLYLDTIASELDPLIPHTVEIRITESGARDFYLVSVIASGAETE